MTHKKISARKPIVLLVLLAPYLLYVWFIVRADRGPIDYETFMDIGQRLLSGKEVWGENSYYPMPYVMIFALFSWLPRPLSMVIWHLGPVLTALAISGWSPWVLVFAPVFGHMVGGQTAVFALLGLWAYHRNADPQNWQGGIWLGLTVLKPQLGLIPTGWAAFQWWKSFRYTKLLPSQMWAWLVMMAVIYLPGFALIPDWPVHWLSQPRPLFSRALAGFIPRTLLFWMSPTEIAYPLVLLLLSTLLFILLWILNKRQITLDLTVFWSFVVSPLVHDYDLIQLVSILEMKGLRWAAILLSIPGWLVILFAYRNDAAWYVFSIIAPGLLLFMLLSRNRKKSDASSS